jgi:hypothetical protein
MLDDDRNNVGVSGVVSGVDNADDNNNNNVYRVSWMINGTRQERFFRSKSWADQFVRKLLEAADLLRTKVDPMVGTIEVADD